MADQLAAMRGADARPRLRDDVPSAGVGPVAGHDLHGVACPLPCGVGARDWREEGDGAGHAVVDALRGENEKLSGGGRSIMSFLKIGDRAAGAIKSGDTTRRAVKMVVGDRHRGLYRLEGEGGAEGRGARRAPLQAGQAAAEGDPARLRQLRSRSPRTGFNLEKNPALKREVKAARKDDVPDGIISRIIQYARQGYTQFEYDTYDTDWESGRRPDRHDRPRHGLRHHRNRARVRLGQVQEARRRRLFQDHQPRRARGLAGRAIVMWDCLEKSL